MFSKSFCDQNCTIIITRRKQFSFPIDQGENKQEPQSFQYSSAFRDFIFHFQYLLGFKIVRSNFDILLRFLGTAIWSIAFMAAAEPDPPVPFETFLNHVHAVP